MTNLDHANEALDRAESGQSFANYPAIFAGFMAMGIAEADIHPRENVFTFAAWIAKGRVVKKGQHGVKVISWIPITDKETGEISGKRPKSATVFHESQTTEIGERKAFTTKETRATYSASKTDAERADHPATDRWIEG